MGPSVIAIASAPMRARWSRPIASPANRPIGSRGARCSSSVPSTQGGRRRSRYARRCPKATQACAQTAPIGRTISSLDPRSVDETACDSCFDCRLGTRGLRWRRTDQCQHRTRLRTARRRTVMAVAGTASNVHRTVRARTVGALARRLLQAAADAGIQHPSCPWIVLAV